MSSAKYTGMYTQQVLPRNPPNFHSVSSAKYTGRYSQQVHPRNPVCFHWCLLPSTQVLMPNRSTHEILHASIHVFCQVHRYVHPTGPPKKSSTHVFCKVHRYVHPTSPCKKSSTHVFCQVHRYVHPTGLPKKSSTLSPMSSAKYTGMYSEQVHPRNPPGFHPCLLPSTQVFTPNRSTQEILYAFTHVFCQVHRYVLPTGPPKKSSRLPSMSSAKYTGMYTQQVLPRNPPNFYSVSSTKYTGMYAQQVHPRNPVCFHWCLLPSTQVLMPNRSTKEILHASTHVFCQVHRYLLPTGLPKKSSIPPPMTSAKYTGRYTQQVCPRNHPHFHLCLLPSTQVCTPNRSTQEILCPSTHVSCQVYRYIHPTGPPKESSKLLLSVFYQVHRYVRPTGPPKKSCMLSPMSSAKYTGTYAQQVHPRNPVCFHPCLLPSIQVRTPNRSAQEIIHASTRVFCQVHRYVHPTGPPKISSTLPPMSSAQYTGMYTQQVRPRNPPDFHPCLLSSTQVCTPNRFAQEILCPSIHVLCQVHRYVYPTGPPRKSSTHVFCQVHRYVCPTGLPKKSSALPSMSSAKYTGMYTQQVLPRNLPPMSSVKFKGTFAQQVRPKNPV